MAKVIFSIASVERRKKLLFHILFYLSEQTVKCDELHLYLSYRKKDKSLENYVKKLFKKSFIHYGKFADAYKFKALDSVPDDSFLISYDDDIIYPMDYSKKIIEGIEKYKRKKICAYHGMHFDFPVVDYCRQRVIYQYFDSVKKDIEVHSIGTGIAGFYVKTLRDTGYKFSKIPKNNCLDESLGKFLRGRDIPMVVLKHKKHWLKIFPDSQDDKSLWVKAAKNKYKEKLKFLDK